jgi:hypothetical protein
MSVSSEYHFLDFFFKFTITGMFKIHKEVLYNNKK